MDNAQLALPLEEVSLVRCSDQVAPPTHEPLADDLHHLVWDESKKRWVLGLTIQFPKLKIVGKRVRVKIPGQSAEVAKGIRDGMIAALQKIGLTVAGRKQTRWSHDPKVRAKNRRTSGNPFGKSHNK